jgi:prepilin-type N-terminal cleavage/methylation domain-containing protein
MKPSAAHNQDGFTLIEVMVAFAILAGAIIMTFQVFGDGLRGLHNNQTRATEMALAQKQMDQLSLAEKIIEGTTEVSQSDIELRIVVSPVKNVGTTQTFQQRPFKIAIYRIQDKENAEPILETILIAKPSTP